MPAGNLLLVNPRSRKRRKSNPESRAKRSRAMKAVWRRRRRSGTKSRRRNPESRRARVAAAKRGWAHRRRNPIRRRRNPISRKSGLMAPIMPAAMGAVAAVGLSVLWGYAPIPATWKTGTLGYGAKAMGALAVGYVLPMVGLKKSTAETLTAAMLTVVFADGLKSVMQSTMPNIPMGEIQPDYGMGALGYISPGIVESSSPQALTSQGTNAIPNGSVAYDQMNAQAGMGF